MSMQNGFVSLPASGGTPTTPGGSTTQVQYNNAGAYEQYFSKSFADEIDSVYADIHKLL